MSMTWENIDKTRQDESKHSIMRLIAHYSIMCLTEKGSGMKALRELFPDGDANELNFVLFSTSGVHGSYNTIEDAELFLQGKDPEGHLDITFLIVHPRLVALRYGNCIPTSEDDINYLKKLRDNSYRAVIG